MQLRKDLAMPYKSSTTYAILGLLTIKPMSAYELVKFSKETIGFFWNESYGNIHKNLKNLLDEGWVDLLQDQSDPRGKKTYAINLAGRQQLGDWLASPPEEVLLRDELLLKLFVSEQKDLGSVVAFVEREAKQMAEAVAVLEQVAQGIQVVDQDPIRKELWMLTLAYGKSYAQTRLAWCQEVDQKLKRINDRG
jgi:DNA-binding PadR family transcriptional regulator